MPLYYDTQDHYTRPYRILIEDQNNINWDELNSEYISEEQITEYIAYTQGLPITEHLVRSYMKKIQFNVILENIKSLGIVTFVCTDGKYKTVYDLGTLARHFELIEDMFNDNIIKEKDTDGSLVLPISLSISDIEKCLCGMTWTPKWGSVGEIPYRALQFLRPKDTAYYLRYAWYLKDQGLSISSNGEEIISLSRQETFKFVEYVSNGLDNDTRAYLSEFTRLTSYILGPIITYMARYSIRHMGGWWEVIRLLLHDLPSAYLSIMCKIGSNDFLVSELAKLQLDDNSINVYPKDWEDIQQRLYQCLKYTKSSNTYMRIMIILGWGTYTSSLSRIYLSKDESLYM